MLKTQLLNEMSSFCLNIKTLKDPVQVTFGKDQNHDSINFTKKTYDTKLDKPDFSFKYISFD